LFDPFGSTELVRDDLVDAEEPWNGEKAGKTPKGKPLQHANHLGWPDLNNGTGKW
jgi:hypothetical protein